MMDQVQQHAQTSSPDAGRVFDIALGAGGVLSLWWLPYLHAASEVAGFLAAAGGLVLVVIRCWIALKEAKALR